MNTAALSRVAFDLPWPWGGERFELSNIKPITYITGPLGSGKTRLAREIAKAVPNAAFSGLERLADEGGPPLPEVGDALSWLIQKGATDSPALRILMRALIATDADVLVVDMVEQGLDHVSQDGLAAYLRGRDTKAPLLFLLTRSSLILNLSAITDTEAIILCPANHSPPFLVSSYVGAPGYESVAMCLASPEVRARTEGTIAWRPQVA